MRRKHWQILVLVFIVGNLGLVQGSTLTKEFKRSFHFRPGGEVTVKNVNGNIHLRSWDVDSVEVFAEIEVKAGSRRDAEECMKRIKIVTDLRRGRLLVEPDYPKGLGGGGFWDWIFGRKPRVKVEFWVRVPEKTDLQLKSVNGNVKVRDVTGRAEFGTTNGSIEADGMEGAVDARSVNGGIRVELMDVDRHEEMSLRTTNGSIKIVLPSDVEADIEASSVNGSISTDFPLEVRGRFNRKRIRGRINGGGGLIDLHTVNGSIRIYEE